MPEYSKADAAGLWRGAIAFGPLGLSYVGRLKPASDAFGPLGLSYVGRLKPASESTCDSPLRGGYGFFGVAYGTSF